MNVYENNGRRLNTRRATDPDPASRDIRPSYRFEVSSVERNRLVKETFRGALLE